MQCNAMQCKCIENAMQCNAMKCKYKYNYNAMQCNAMQCNAIALKLLCFKHHVPHPICTCSMFYAPCTTPYLYMWYALCTLYHTISLHVVCPLHPVPHPPATQSEPTSNHVGATCSMKLPRFRKKTPMVGIFSLMLEISFQMKSA